MLTFLKKHPKSASWTEEKVRASQHFCMMPWVHLHLTQQGTVTPCCQAPWQAETAFGIAGEEKLEKIWNGAPLRKFRRKMLRDQPDDRCKRCYEKEKSGWKSLRQMTNANYLHQLPRVQKTRRNGAIPGTQPVYFDLRFSNVCNLKCRICGPWSSSSWHKDAVALGMLDAGSPALTRPVSDPKELFAEIEPWLDQVEEIYFAGGEPLMMQEHYELLDRLIERGNTQVRLQYNTNFSTLSLQEREVTELWKQFPNVRISASLDGSGKRGEFLRKNLNWGKVEQNRERLRQELPHVKFLVTSTLCVFNALHLPDFHREWVKKEWIRAEDFIPSLLIQPDYYNIRVLPESLKAKVREKFSSHLEWLKKQPVTDREQMDFCLGQFENALQHLDSEDHSGLLGKLKEQTQKLDRLRDEKAASIFPELQAIFPA